MVLLNGFYEWKAAPGGKKQVRAGTAWLNVRAIVLARVRVHVRGMHPLVTDGLPRSAQLSQQIQNPNP